MSAHPSEDEPTTRRKDSNSWIRSLSKRLKSSEDGQSSASPPSSFPTVGFTFRRPSFRRKRAQSTGDIPIRPHDDRKTTDATQESATVGNTTGTSLNGNGSRTVSDMGKGKASLSSTHALWQDWRDKPVPPLPTESNGQDFGNRPEKPLPIWHDQTIPFPTVTVNDNHASDSMNGASSIQSSSAPGSALSKVTKKPVRSQFTEDFSHGDEIDHISALAHEGLVEKVELETNSPEPKGTILASEEVIIEGVIEPVLSEYAVATTLYTPLKAIWNATAEEASPLIDSMTEGVPVLMNMLDEVARLHPVVTAAVMIFRTVYTLEATRRENDKRVRLLYVDMRDMMSALYELKDIKDRKQFIQGFPIEDRLNGVAQRAEKDIRDCALACDTFTKKSMVSKVLKGSIYCQKLATFTDRFNSRRVEFQQALGMHTARTVDAIHSQIDSTNKKMDTLITLFEALRPETEKKIAHAVTNYGGTNFIRTSDASLQKLIQIEIDAMSLTNRTQRSDALFGLTIADLREELSMDWDASLSANFDSFESKLRMKLAEVQVELRNSMSDIKTSVADLAGPYEKIKNQELRSIWKDMNWRRNVKARVFVMTLRDHFRERAQNSSAGAPSSSDDWALQYIDLSWLNPIMDAFDDDSTGFITIEEVNRFTDAMPENLRWSLQLWIAYWAVGWQVISSYYIKQIHHTFAIMFGLRSRILPQNRCWVDHYLSLVWFDAHRLVSSFNSGDIPDNLQHKFQLFVKQERERLTKNLEALKYIIDEPETVRIISGPGRLENHLVALISILLKRDLELFKLAQTRVLHRDQFGRAAHSFVCISKATMSRAKELKTLFSRQKSSARDIKEIASELFEYLADPEAEVYTMKYFLGYKPAVIPTQELDLQTPDQHSHVLLSIENKMDEDSFDQTYMPQPAHLKEGDWENSDGALQEILGEWQGFLFSEAKYPRSHMWSVFLEPNNSVGEHAFKGSTSANLGGEHVVEGSCMEDAYGAIHLTFTILYPSGSLQYFSGSLDAMGTLTGKTAFEANINNAQHQYDFLFKKTSPEGMACRPTPFEFAANKYRALWKYALTYAQREVQRKMPPWEYFLHRRTRRLRYIELMMMLAHNSQHPHDEATALSEEQEQEIRSFRQNMTSADAVFYSKLCSYQSQLKPRHFGMYCDGCESRLHGHRTVCLDCLESADKMWDSVEFCDKVTCRDRRIERLSPLKPHLISHDYVKVGTYLHYRDYSGISEKAKAAISSCRSRMRGISRPSVPHDRQETEDTAETIVCSICHSLVHGECWYCVECKDTFICDDCETRKILSCVLCRSPYSQPSWYYGSQKQDMFTCNTCYARGRKPKTRPVNPHNYTHPLVRCKDRTDNDAEFEPPTTADKRLESLEDRVKKVEDMIGSVDSRILNLERNIQSTLNKVLSKLDSLHGDMEAVVNDTA